MSGQQPSGSHPPLRQKNTFQSDNGDIDLRELFKAIWEGKVIIIVTTFLFVMSATGYAFFTPSVYQAQSTFLIEKNFYNLFNATEKSELAIEPELVTNAVFKNKLIEQVHLDRALLSGVNISYDKRSDTFSVTRLSTNPQSAFESVETVTNALNNVVKLQELKKVKFVVEALQANRDTSGAVKTKEYFDELLAQQIFKKVMLESPNTELVKVIRQASVPKSHVTPKRPMIIVLGTLLGGLFGVAIVLIQFAFRKETTDALH